MILNYHIHSAETKRHILEAGIIHESTTGLLFVVALNVIILIYLIASLRIMANYQQRIKEEFSNTRRIDLSWLRFLLLGFCLIWILDVTHFFVSLAQDSYPHNLSIAVLGLLFIYANSILYFGLKQPAIFNGVKEKSKYKNSNLTLAGIEQYKTKLLEFMEKEKPYLDPDLKMQDLAESLSIPARHLSQVINDKLGQNFFDFVSSYRIKEAKKHLIDKNNGNTVLEILYDAGFNAKSTFNNIFKKKTGLTPTQYKRQHTSETG
jgi:AraC-like DNA-binding protein